jgi:hypothetical protein
MNDNEIAEQVAEALEGKKLFRVHSTEQVYMFRDVWAVDADEAENICMADGDWGEVTDSNHFEVTEVEKLTGGN